tara:strand:+ start:41522 stop:41761 length:240 start_codon:yes stop_codon:yes gene_type:complete
MKLTTKQLKEMIAEELEEIRLGMHPGESHGFQPRHPDSEKMDSYAWPHDSEESTGVLSIEDRVDNLETKIDLILTKLGA